MPLLEINGLTWETHGLRRRLSPDPLTLDPGQTAVVVAGGTRRPTRSPTCCSAWRCPSAARSASAARRSPCGCRRSARSGWSRRARGCCRT
ncbi:hypothetical protein ACFQQB_29280 [Nonomuraea rubra]|uniref:hypothetical protein n=1 Tax=Nonomuraea rubra TaxID=46180 RepID=UPI00361B0484